MERLYTKQKMTAQLHGQQVPYIAEAGDYLLRNTQGEVEASLFVYSYMLETPHTSERPVLFGYNGGPGSDSIWLHMGLLGPFMVPTGEPGEKELIKSRTPMEPNGAFLIEQCDIVLIDPPGAGYARVWDDDKRKKYFSTPGDAAAFVRFIEDWLEQHGRWASPVYLIGESYGTIRSVVIADTLSKAVNLCGIISIGTSFNVGAPELPVEPSVRRFGAYAATAWYHKAGNKSPLSHYLEQALAFARGEYATALLMGNDLPEDAFEHCLERTAYFTGMPEDTLRRSRLRLKQEDFIQQLLPGAVISPYDGRAFSPKSENRSADPLAEDPILMRTSPAFNAAIRRYLSEQLALRADRAYIVDTLDIAMNWDFSGVNTMAMLERLMRRRSRLRILFVSGVYDLQSTFDFVRYYLSQKDIPASRVRLLETEAGHMAYLGRAFGQVTAALQEWIH